MSTTTMENAAIVERSDGCYVVEGTTVLAGPFASNAEAWTWTDRNTLRRRGFGELVT
jgi:hypothetical protein